MSNKNGIDKSVNNEDIVVDKSSQINLVIKGLDEEADSITLLGLLKGFKKTSDLFKWIVLLLVIVGMCVPLFIYQFNVPTYTATSIVTLDYDIEVETATGTEMEHVSGLVAPDGTDLDLSYITSSYVLQNALEGIVLSENITVSELRNSIAVQMVLTEESRRQQEIVENMIKDGNSSAYVQAQDLVLEYENKFIVTLTNSFVDENTKKVKTLRNEEAKRLLDSVVNSYNDYLFDNYVQSQLPGDEISAIDYDSMDILESLDELGDCIGELYDFCDEMPESIKTYRSFQSGHSLVDLMETLQTVKEINVDYLYSYVYASSMTRDRENMLTNYRFQLRNAQIQVNEINEKIATTQAILDTYKNDNISVSMQDSASVMTTKSTTEYYNTLIIAQAENYEKAAKLKIKVEELEGKIKNLQEGNSDVNIKDVQSELESVFETSTNVYNAIYSHLEEAYKSAFHTKLFNNTNIESKTQSFISANVKGVVIGAVGGLMIALVIWFVKVLFMEIARIKEDDMEAVR
ncbi:MAG: hypothetical protein K6F92_04235 [Lachnospiraceae bacterium]|nr:hypothetical protein [Lachnospiraceae bacterium]